MKQANKLCYLYTAQTRKRGGGFILKGIGAPNVVYGPLGSYDVRH